MRQVKAKVIRNRKVARDFYEMAVESSYLADNAKPGQFIEVRCSKALEPLLRRPLGVHRISKNVIWILYEIVGKGTGLLSQKRKGEYIDIIGPLGKGFDAPSPSEKRAIIVAGGIGVAPLLALAGELVRKKIKTEVLIGAKQRSHVLCEKEFKAMGCSVKTATEDGSKGYRGLITDLLKNLLKDKKEARAAVYACGPDGMLKAVSHITEAAHLNCQVSLETHMACGVGVCLGCPVKIKTQYAMPNMQYEYKMVCKDGPVFNAGDIAW